MLCKSKVLSNLIWRFLERFGVQVVTFLVSVVLARILTPEDYGKIAIVTVLVTILNVFVDSGFANALIQKKNADDLDFSTVFYFNLLLCIIIYVGVWASAPEIASFYGDMEYIPIIRVVSFSIVVSGIKNVQQAYVAKNFLFKKFFFSTLGGTIVSAGLGILFALRGFGVWAVVVQYLSNTIVDTMVLWYIVEWKPIWAFSFQRLWKLFSYGYKLLVSSLLNTIYNNIRQLVIGKLYSSADLAYYNKGEQFPSLLMVNINTSLDSVLFPTMSEQQDDREKVRNTVKKSIVISTFLLWPLLVGLAVMAEEIVSVVLTEKWLQCVPYMRIFCAVYATHPIQTASLNAIKAIGRSEIFLKLEILQTLAGCLLLVAVIRKGAMWIALMCLVSSIFSCIVICRECKNLFGYGIMSQIKDLVPNLFISLFMGACISNVQLEIDIIGNLVCKIVIAGLIYIGGSILLKNKGLKLVIEYIPFFHRNISDKGN